VISTIEHIYAVCGVNLAAVWAFIYAPILNIFAGMGMNDIQQYCQAKFVSFVDE
jgi:hypothetical protein